jgi:hypothetical protein
MIAALVLVATLSTPIAQEERPSNGLGLTIAGGVVTGLGALNLASSAICRTGFYRDRWGDTRSDICFWVAIGLGVVELAVGVPMLVVGLVRRSAYKEWLQKNAVSIVPRPDGLEVAYLLRF